MTPEVQAERSRCALACYDLELRWRSAANRIREAGTRKSWLFGTYVMPHAERKAAAIEAAANGLAAVRKIIVAGMVPKRGVYRSDEAPPVNLGNYSIRDESKTP